MSGTRLDPIVRDVKRRSAERRAKQPLNELRRNARADDSRRQRFLSALSSALSIGELAFIAELKRRSPSAGALHITANLDPATASDSGRSAWAALASAYARGGATALSVLTEEDHFAGCLADLETVAFTRLPRLRKDFILDEGMLLESVVHGADAVLLLPVILDDTQLADLSLAARELGLAALVEVHDERELERALALEPEIVGVNARDLSTFEVDIANIECLLPRIPSACIKVAESGMRTLADLKRVRAAGANAALIGEALVRSGDPERMLRTWKDGLRG